MKTIALSAIGLIAYVCSYAQEDVSLDQMLVNISKSTVTSGIIYERVATFGNLYRYNTLQDTADVLYFEQAESEMYRASNQTKFISNTALRALYAPKSQTNVVDIGILNTQYQYLNYNSNNPSLGGLTLSNNTFYQISGKPPFNSSSFVMIAPLKENAVGSSITYNFKSNLWFTNGTKTVKNVTAVLGDGVSRNVITNGSIATPAVAVSYTSTGYKYLKFTVIFSDNSTHVTYGKIYVNTGVATKGRGSMRLIDNFTLTAAISFKGYDETVATPAQIQYRVFYRTNNGNTTKKLMKPVIISDGFDPGDKRKIEPSDYAHYDPNKDISIDDMVQYTDCDGSSKNLIDVLNAKGYDVVVVNYITYTSSTTGKEIDGGADFIERNAMAMVALIQALNTKLTANGSAEQLVVVGPSMGGQITRYALAYMEKQYAATGNSVWLHKTRLWISVDSPHLGANIPEGLQALVNLLKDEPTAADFYYKDLGSAAAKQQLINWHQEGSSYYSVNTADLNGRTTTQGFPTNSGSSFYQQFYNSQFNNGLANSKGYPVNLRKIAMANGSVTGKTYGTDGQQTLNIRGFTNVCLIWCWDVHVASLETYTMPAYGTDHNIARYKKGFNDRHTHAPNNDPRGNPDILPGGWYPGYQILDESVMGTSTGVDYTVYFPFFLGFLSKANVFLEERTNAGSHCFIPTFSALGMKSPNQNWGQSLKRNLVCSSEIPFDSYFGHDLNTKHTSFDCESVAWLLKELDGVPQAPWFPMTEADLSGPATVCLNDTKSYTFASLCSLPSSATWTLSSNLQNMGSTPTSISVKSVTQGTGTITATFTNGEKVVKTINSGAPMVSASGSPRTGCNNGYQTWNLTASPSNAGSNWNWSVDYLGQNANIYINAPYSVTTTADVKGGGTVKLYYTDLCGIATNAGGPTVYSSCPPGFQVSPNPAKTYITVKMEDGSYKGRLSSLFYAIKITDHFGRVRKSFEYKNGLSQKQIPVADLNVGTYQVSIYDGHQWGGQSLLISK